MLIGRHRRKAISQAIAFGTFRWLILWIIVAICASYGRAGQSAALAIFAVDIMITGTIKGLAFGLDEQVRKVWADELTHRIFYKMFWDELRGGGVHAIDVDGLFSLATKEAAADLAKADERDIAFDSTAWHWFGGFLSFCWLIIGYGLYYGSAIYFGSTIAPSY